MTKAGKMGLLLLSENFRSALSLVPIYHSLQISFTALNFF